ncbi:homeobox protein CDX-4 [Ornithorhynchus anatinus]|uniref:homeobox protein CDX-4 n=1 Tax=Ornithorhynchus anatinus TaxID=9258 RepID=UPI0010A90F68|nr:homeobox protein CDX-4 [Ornithorhynchus anatinus]
MFGSCPAERGPPMYPGSLRAGGGPGPLAGQSFGPGPPYADYMGYPAGPGLDGPGPPYGPPREDWGVYGAGPSAAPAPGPYGSPDYGAPAAPGPGGPPPGAAAGAHPLPPAAQRQVAYEWMRRTVQSAAAGKTRTREKYRVVYTDHQRLELEKEFRCNRYITIRRKSELAANLGLSERQVKIWFQNRRAKERKMIKKKISQFDGSGGSAQSDSGSVSPAELPSSLFPPPHAIRELQPIEVHQVIVSE